MAYNLQSVLLLDNIDKECGRLLEEANIVTKTVLKLTKDELIAELQKHDGVIVRSATKLTAEVLNQCSNLKVIGRAGTGVDNIDVNAATKKGIVVMNTPGGNTLSAAELTCALICSLARSIPQACAALKLGNWDRKKYMGNELYGKTLAIIGLGRIGREVSSRMKSFGMNVIGYDPIVSKEAAEEWGIGFYQLEDIWPKADYITVHTPLIPQTKNLISEKSLAMCKTTVKIVNVARGGIVDEDALLKALEAGKCGGAGIDVFIQEPPTNLKLLKHPSVICTPHLGANTYEAQRRVAVEMAEQLIEMSLGRSYSGIVNCPELSETEVSNSHLWVQLAEHIGSTCAQLKGDYSKPLTINIQTSGKEMKLGVIKCAILAGFFANLPLTRRVNLVNATTVALENEFAVSLKHIKCDINETMITLEVLGKTKAHSVTGTVTNGRSSICELDGSLFDPPLILGDHLILLKCNEFELATQITPVSEFGLLSVTISKDMKWCAITTRKYAEIKALISVRL